jgi:PAS domain-containing protein
MVGLAAYLFTSSLIIAIGEAMRRAQARARERSDLLRITLASIGDAMITTDNAGHVTYLNAVAESLTGWRQEDATASRWTRSSRPRRTDPEAHREPGHPGPARRARW